MGKIILPEPRYHFMKQESRSLDLEVDKLTRAFDSDEGLREVLAEQYYWENVPGNWREAGSPAVIARIVRGMLDYIDVIRNEIAHYTLPTIVIPGEAQEYQKRLLMQEELEDDLVLQGQVSEFEKALEGAYFEFCKQAMAHLLANIAGEPHVEYRNPGFSAIAAMLITMRLRQNSTLQG
jgi:hypothetical protein